MLDDTEIMPTDWAQAIAQADNTFAVAMSRYARAPIGFVREVLGVQPDAWQIEVLRTLAHGHTRISIKSGHGVGKALAVRTKILTYNRGWVRAGGVNMMDTLVAVDGTPTKILGIFPQGERQMYRVITDDGGA